MRHESVFNINGLSVELCVFGKLEMQEQSKTNKLEIKQSRHTRICIGGSELSLSTPLISSEPDSSKHSVYNTESGNISGWRPYYRLNFRVPSLSISQGQKQISLNESTTLVDIHTMIVHSGANDVQVIHKALL